jgi:hypothetical protein
LAFRCLCLARCTLLHRSTYQPSITLRVHTFFVMCLLRSSIICAQDDFSPRKRRASRYECAYATTDFRASFGCITTSYSLDRALCTHIAPFKCGGKATGARRARSYTSYQHITRARNRVRTRRREPQRGRYLPRFGERKMVLDRPATLRTRPWPFALRKDVLPGHPQYFAG